MGRHEAAGDDPDPVVAAALTGRAESRNGSGGGAHAADQPRRGPVGWQGPEPDPSSKLGWPGDLVPREG